MKVTILTSLKHSAPRDSQAPQSDVTRKDIDWRNSSDRKWLMNHIHWAMNNSHIVRLIPHSN